MKRVLYIMCAIMLVCSCTKEDRNNMLVTQEEAIDKYISSLDDVRVVRNGGSNRLVYVEGAGKDSLAVGDTVRLYYAGYMFYNGRGDLFVTNHPQTAQENDFPLTGTLQEVVIGGRALIEGLEKGLVGAKAGEKCDIVFSAKYGYNNTIVYNVPKMTPLIFEVWVDSIGKN